MLITLHKNATTTPATRLALQQASGTDRELAQQYDLLAVVREFIEPAMSRSALRWTGCCAGEVTPDCLCGPSQMASASPSKPMNQVMCTSM